MLVKLFYQDLYNDFIICIVINISIYIFYYLDYIFYDLYLL